MQSSRCAFSTSAALHRVFVRPARQLQLQSTHRPFQLSKTPTSQLPFLQRRTIVTYSPADKRRLPRDEEITSWSVSIIDEEGKLSEPRSKAAVLDRIDRNLYSLVVVEPIEPGVLPKCKIMDKKLLREAEKAKQKATRKSATTAKVIELNWAIDGNDLGHRLKKIQEFLSKGFKVEVALAAKKKGRKATPEEAAALVKKLEALVEKVEGAKETKVMEGKLLGPAKFFFEGKK